MSEADTLPAPANAGAIFRQAIQQHQQGHLQQANALCEKVLQADPRHAAAWHMRGLIALNGTEPHQGAEWIMHSLELDANQPPAHVNLGNFLLAQNQTSRALTCFERALRLKADYPLALYNRGNALSTLGRFSEALASYDQALRLQPNWMTQNNRGLVLLKLGRTKAAAAAFAAAILLDAHAIDPQRNLGNAYLELDRPLEALDCLHQACSLAPGQPDCWHGLGNAWLALKRPDEAIRAYSRALRLRPDHAQALCGRSAAAVALRQPSAALVDAEFALTLCPPTATLLNNLGNALVLLERSSEALSRYEAALRLDASCTDALYNRASLLRRLARANEAASTCRKLLRVAPRHRYAFGLYFQLCMDLCDWREYEAMQRRLSDSGDEHRDILNPMTLLLLDSPSAQRRGAARFSAEQSLAPVASPLPPHEPASARVRIAYISADFRDHPVAHLLVGVLEQHDRSRFEVLGVSLTPAERSDFGDRVRAAFDHIIDVQDQSDEQVALRLRELKVDIAVDLMGFTEGQRLGIFARRVAPAQVAYLGFAGTIGSTNLDYLIADDVSLPAGQQDFFAEKIVRLPHCFLPNDDRRVIGAAPPRATLGLPETELVLCAFANSCKINPPLFEIWMQLLREIPGSVLWLRDSGPTIRENLAQEARRRGVQPERLVFAPRMDAMSDHLARLSCADLFLDTTPYNAHSTACDCLWAGVPVVTCQGESFASRVAASALHSVGLSDLAAESFAQYRDIVLRLARQPELLRDIRARLMHARISSPLFQTAKYTRNLESIFQSMLTPKRNDAGTNSLDGIGHSPHFAR